MLVAILGASKRAAAMAPVGLTVSKPSSVTEPTEMETREGAGAVSSDNMALKSALPVGEAEVVCLPG